jgi:hypothetical protein
MSRLRFLAFAFLRHVLLTLRILQVRFRFFAVALIAFVIVGNWDFLRNHWDKLTRSGAAPPSAMSPDTEYWCPMCPGVVADWPGKCPVCNMALVRRKRGEATPLPDGVLARMQVSPYRMQLAGIRTSPVQYRPLAYEVETAGSIEVDTRPLAWLIVEPKQAVMHAELSAKWLPVVKKGQTAEVHCAAYPGRAPFKGRVRGLSSQPGTGTANLRVAIAIDDPGQELPAGLVATARVQVPAADIEPFRSMPDSLPPLQPGEIRLAYFCPDHAERLADSPGRCPVDQNELEKRTLADNQRLKWWCPMHPQVTARAAGGVCPNCQGMKLVPRIITYHPPGQVLALPDSAVVNTGTRQVVYVERAAGMFDGIEVQLGPRCGDYFPVIRGLEAGERVATAGAFLIDAETRLNPGMAAGYFGAARNSAERQAPAASPPAEAPDVTKALLPLAPADRVLARRQKTCPVTGQVLGSMGTPVRVMVEGRTVFLCCEGCEPRLRKDPSRYLVKLHD